MTTPYQDLVNEIEETLIYAGFNAINMRKTVIEEFDREEVVKVISIYVMTGNSIAEKVSKKKIADYDEAKSLVQFLKEKKVFGKKKNLDSLTLARFAITFPVLTLKIRMMMRQLRSKLTTTTPVVLQDLCFNSFLSEPMVSAASDFIDKFSFVLAKAKDPLTTLEQSQEKVKSFRSLGEEGHRLDVVGQVVFKLNVETADVDQILTAYGFPSMSATALPSTKADRAAYVKEEKNRVNVLKVVEIEEVPKDTKNRAKVIKGLEEAAILAWVSAGT